MNDNELETAKQEIYAKLNEAVLEIENGAEGVDAEEFIESLMNSPKDLSSFVEQKRLNKEDLN